MRYMAPKEHSLLAPHLPKQVRAEYMHALPGDMLKKFELALGSVMRFESDPRIQKQKGGFTESDLDHVGEIQEILTDIENTHRSLPKEVDFTVARKFAIVHDVGEIIAKDYPAIGAYRQTPEAQRAKRLESYCAVLILRNIPDPSMRAHAIQLFERYEKQECPESRFVKFIDSIQGNRTLIRHIINYTDRGVDTPESWMETHVTLSLQKTIDRATSIRELLTENAQKDIDFIFFENMQEYAKRGYTGFADEACESYTRQVFPRSGLIMHYEHA